MNITSTFSLKAIVKSSVVYIEWTSSGSFEDEAMKARWNSFSSKHCEGKDAFGKYYSSTKGAGLVIRAFRAREKERADKLVEVAKKMPARPTNKRLFSTELLPGEKVDFRKSKGKKAAKKSKDQPAIPPERVRQPLDIVGLRKLEIAVTTFFDDLHISCPEAVCQNDDVITNAYDFITNLGDIVGYYKEG